MQGPRGVGKPDPERSAELCARKISHPTWEAARLAGLDVWRNNPRPTDANMPTPYPCGDHYHVGHLRFGAREVA